MLHSLVFAAVSIVGCCLSVDLGNVFVFDGLPGCVSPLAGEITLKSAIKREESRRSASSDTSVERLKKNGVDFTELGENVICCSLLKLCVSYFLFIGLSMFCSYFIYCSMLIAIFPFCYAICTFG